MVPYKEKWIKDLSTDKNKIAVSGFIISKEGSNLMLDDNTGILQVEIENNFNVNDYVRIFGNLIEIDGKFVLKGDAIQNFNKINKELHKKIKDLL